MCSHMYIYGDVSRPRWLPALRIFSFMGRRPTLCHHAGAGVGICVTNVPLWCISNHSQNACLIPEWNTKVSYGDLARPEQPVPEIHTGLMTFGGLLCLLLASSIFLFCRFESVIQGREMSPSPYWARDWLSFIWWDGGGVAPSEEQGLSPVNDGSGDWDHGILVFQSRAGGLLFDFLFLSSLPELHCFRCLAKACCI